MSIAWLRALRALVVATIVSMVAACTCPTTLQQSNCASANMIYDCLRACIVAADPPTECTGALDCCLYVKEIVPIYAQLDIDCSNGFGCGAGAIPIWLFVVISASVFVGAVILSVLVWKCWLQERCCPPPPPPPPP